MLLNDPHGRQEQRLVLRNERDERFARGLIGGGINAECGEQRATRVVAGNARLLPRLIDVVRHDAGVRRELFERRHTGASTRAASGGSVISIDCSWP